MSGLRELREAFIQGKIHDAAEGDMDALHYLGELLTREKPSPSLCMQMLPVIPGYLKSSTPHPAPAPAESMNKEASAVTALYMLTICIAKVEDTESTTHSAFNLLYEEADNIIRWLSHLLTFWVLEHRTNYSNILPTKHYPIGAEAYAAYMLERILRTADAIMTAIGRRNPKIRTLVKDNVLFGTLLSITTIAIVREKRLDEMPAAMNITVCLLKEHGSGQPWETSFFAYLESSARKFAVDIAVLLVDYVDSPLNHGQKTTIPTLTVLLKQLVYYFRDHDIILDAFLEQEGTFRTFASIFRSMVDQWIKDWKISRAHPSNFNNVLVTILDLSAIFSRCFLRGGPLLMSIALEEGFLDRISTFHETLNVNRLTPTYRESVDSRLGAVVEQILPFVVYPSVFWNISASFFRRYREYEGPALSKLPGLHAALWELSRRLREEVLIITQDLFSRPLQKPGSHDYISSFIFCDSCQCSGTSSKVGQCSSCQSAFYCSRRCQRAGWGKGHRQECKQISSGCLGSTDGLPLVATIHDREYFKRTLPYRFNFYADFDSPNRVVNMDFTRSHVRRLYGLSSHDPLEGGEECGCSPDEMLVRATFPTCEKLGQPLKISVHGVRYRDLSPTQNDEEDL